jgi:hypothetical protein
MEDGGRLFATLNPNCSTVVVVAKALTDQLPNHPTGWLLLAEAKHVLDDTESAYRRLLSVGEQFGEHYEITYALAVYASLTGNFMEAEDWLARSLDIGGTKIKLKALRPKFGGVLATYRTHLA